MVATATASPAVPPGVPPISDVLIAGLTSRAIKIAHRFAGPSGDLATFESAAIGALENAAKRFRGESRFWTFAYPCIKNALRDESRKQKRRNKHEVTATALDLPENEDGTGGSFFNRVPDPKAPEPLEQMAREEMIQDMWAAVEKLPEEDRLLIQWKFFEHRTEQEIAELLEIDQSTVSRRIAKVLAGLKESLE